MEQAPADLREYMRVLNDWFRLSGTTLDALIADIERTESGRAIPGLASRIIGPVSSAPINHGAKIAIIRAMQHLAIVRPWEGAQGDLFSEQQ